MLPVRKTCLLEYTEKRNIDEAKIHEDMRHDPHLSYSKNPEWWEEHWKPVPMWHGTRRKESATQLKRRGFPTFSCDEAKREAYLALKALNKLAVLAEAGNRGQMLRDKLSQTCRFEAHGIYVDAFDEKQRTENMGFDQTCGYASNNPEIISDVLSYAGVNRGQVVKYLKARFGTPYKVKLVHRTPAQINLATHCNWIQPSDIEEITECPEP